MYIDDISCLRESGISLDDIMFTTMASLLPLVEVRHRTKASRLRYVACQGGNQELDPENIGPFTSASVGSSESRVLSHAFYLGVRR